MALASFRSRWALAARVLAALALAFMTPVRLPADGFIYIPEIRIYAPPVPSPSLRPLPWPARPNFPLQVTRHRVAVEIEETAARTRVEESFYNPNDSQLEGVYIFPLPAEAAISGFAMKMGGKVVSGEVLEKQKARELYEQIVRQVRDPGLLEYVDRGLFRASVFPIPARGTVEVSIEYAETVRRERGTATYVYPLDTGKYSAGPYRDVLVDVRLRSGAPLRAIHCPSHEGVAVSRSGEKEARVTLESKELRAEKDFVLTWHVSEDALAPFVITHRGSEVEGFFYLNVSPRQEKPRTVVPKDIAFVLDTSGSMLGAKIEQVKAALRHGITGLNPGDRFNIITFSTEARRFRDGLVEATDESRKLAHAFIEELKASGGTNLEEGLRWGLGDLQSADRLQLVVLLSDGEPTIGVTSPNDIARLVKERNPQRRRVFVFGVGEDLNAKLLDQVAKDSAGATQYLRSSENLEVPLSTFFDKIDSPVFTDMHLELPAGGVTDLYPRPLPDLFRGDQLEVFGRYAADGSKTVVLRGKYQGEERVFEYSLPFAGGQNGYVARLWAFRKVGYLLEQMRLAGESKEVKDEVVRLSKLYGIITPFTSYLILEEDRVTRQESPAVPGFQWAHRFAASEALGQTPGGAAAAGVEVARRARAASKSFGEASGADAVELSVELDALARGAGGRALYKFVDGTVNRSSVRLKQVDDRSFYLQGDRWVDAALTGPDGTAGRRERRVKYLSDDYFALLTSEPRIGKMLSVDQLVTFQWKGEVIAIEG